MGAPVAKQGDAVTAVDTHLVVPPPPASGAIPLPHRFTGRLDGQLSNNVSIMGRPAATAGSTATNTPPHIPSGGGSFSRPPSNRGTVAAGSATVLVNGRPLARSGDQVITCNDPADAPVGRVVAVGTVLAG